MRVGVVLLLVGAVAAADDTSEALADIDADSVDTIQRGIDVLLDLDDEKAAGAMIAALRKARDRHRVEWDRYERRIAKAGSELERLGKKAEKLGALGLAATGDDLEKLDQCLQEMQRVLQQIMAAVDDARPHVERAYRLQQALAKFRGRGALSAIGAVATREKPGPVRYDCIHALVRNAGAAGVAECLKTCARDAAWQVRVGAYRALGGSSLADAVPTLIAARGTEAGQPRLRIDCLLWELTGVGRRKQDSWTAWWQANEQAARAGTLAKVSGEARPDPSTGAFRLPLASENILFVIDARAQTFASYSHGEDAVAAKLWLPHTRLGYAMRETIRAIESLPNGARFNILAFNDRVRRFSAGPTVVSDDARRRAAGFLRLLESAGKTSAHVLLGSMMTDYPSRDRGAKLFGELPDTICLVIGDVEEKELTPLAQDFAMWNAPCDIVLHVVAIGENYPKEQLALLASSNGGALAIPFPR